jgi:hypothetical protein
MRQALTAALDQSHPASAYVLALIDLATSELHSGDLSASCSPAIRADDLLRHAGYAVGAARMRAIRAATLQPLSNRALRVLDEHVTRITA